MVSKVLQGPFGLFPRHGSFRRAGDFHFRHGAESAARRSARSHGSRFAGKVGIESSKIGMMMTNWWFHFNAEKYESQMGLLFPTEWKNKKCSKPPTRWDKVEIAGDVQKMKELENRVWGIWVSHALTDPNLANCARPNQFACWTQTVCWTVSPANPTQKRKLSKIRAKSVTSLCGYIVPSFPFPLILNSP